MFKTSIIRDDLGGFDPTIRYAQDWELWSRVLPKYRLANVQEFLLYVREHPGASSTSTNNVMRTEQFRINRLNPDRVLGIVNDDEDWLLKVDTLRMKRVKNPEDRLEVIDLYFDRFRRLYPNACYDPTVLRILAEQYLKLLSIANSFNVQEHQHTVVNYYQKKSKERLRRCIQTRVPQ